MVRDAPGHGRDARCTTATASRWNGSRSRLRLRTASTAGGTVATTCDRLRRRSTGGLVRSGRTNCMAGEEDQQAEHDSLNRGAVMRSPVSWWSAGCRCRLLQFPCLATRLRPPRRRAGVPAPARNVHRIETGIPVNALVSPRLVAAAALAVGPRGSSPPGRRRSTGPREPVSFAGGRVLLAGDARRPMAAKTRAGSPTPTTRPSALRRVQRRADRRSPRVPGRLAFLDRNPGRNRRRGVPMPGMSGSVRSRAAGSTSRPDAFPPCLAPSRAATIRRTTRSSATRSSTST